MKEKEKFIELLYKASTGIANAVLVTLGIGLLFESIGGYLDWSVFLAIGGRLRFYWHLLWEPELLIS